MSDNSNINSSAFFKGSLKFLGGVVLAVIVGLILLFIDRYDEENGIISNFIKETMQSTVNNAQQERDKLKNEIEALLEDKTTNNKLTKDNIEKLKDLLVDLQQQKNMSDNNINDIKSSLQGLNLNFNNLDSRLKKIEDDRKKPKLYKININTNPSNTKIKLSKKSKQIVFHQGIKLSIGNYKIKISKSGYNEITKNIYLNSDKSFDITLNLKDWKPYYTKGNQYFQKGDYLKAIDEYSKAIKINPNNIDIYKKRLQSYKATGNMKFLDKVFEENKKIEALLGF